MNNMLQTLIHYNLRRRAISRAIQSAAYLPCHCAYKGQSTHITWSPVLWLLTLVTQPTVISYTVFCILYEGGVKAEDGREWCWRRCMGLGGTRWPEAVGHCVTRSVMLRNFRQIFIGWGDKGEWDGWHVARMGDKECLKGFGGETW